MAKYEIHWRLWEPPCCEDHDGYYWTHHSEEREFESVTALEEFLESERRSNVFDNICATEV